MSLSLDRDKELALHEIEEGPHDRIRSSCGGGLGFARGGEDVNPGYECRLCGDLAVIFIFFLCVKPEG